MIDVNSLRLAPRRRRMARNLARAGSAFAAAMVMGTLFVGHSPIASAVAENAGTALIVNPPNTPGDGAALSSGGSATVFAMTPPQGGACPGSGSGTPPYRWHAFFVASSVDPGALTFASGPNAVGSAFVSPMFSAAGDPINNKNPAATPLGLINGIPTMSFGVFKPGDVPAGTYKIGIACTLAGATVKFWSTTITVTTAAGDSPAGFTWSTATSTPTTTTVAQASTTTTAAGATTTTAAAGATTTTVASGVTTTTVKPATTSTLGGSGSSTTTTLLGSGSATTTTVKAVTLPGTGSESMSLWVWALLALIFGRMAVLLGRPIKVL